MTEPFLSRPSLFGRSNAMLILIVIFFFIPWALRGARKSLEKTENNVKDWLPSDFVETSELAWFGDYFAGERFILATWPDCTADDERLRLFAEKLRAESEEGRPDVVLPHWEQARAIAQQYHLLLPADVMKNWGGREEKWLYSEDGTWFFITPNGRLYRYEGEANAVRGTITAIRRLLGGFEVKGTFVQSFGGTDDPQVINPYYNNPALLTAPLFRTVQTGPDVVSVLAAEGGPLWPIDLTDRDQRPRVAARRATERLTGTLFAPPVPRDFPWTAEALIQHLDHIGEMEWTPEELPIVAESAIERVVDSLFAGDRHALLSADSVGRAEAWYAVFDHLKVEPPAAQTCVMLTLTPLGLRNLPYVVGRGVLGGPRGRVLTLADQSGLEPAPIPSAAPPPFDRVLPIGVTGRPPLRLGGPPVDNVSIDEEGTITLVRLVGYSVLIGVVLSFLCFRSIKITLMVFLVGGLSAVVGMAIVGWTGTAVDAILLSMPSLVYVLGLSGAIHVVNYYRDEVESHGQKGAAERAFRHAIMPCTLAAVTTAIGLLSLYTSNITPIRKFGLFSALGVLATVLIVLSYLPAALETFVPQLKLRAKSKRGDIGDGGFLGRFWGAIGNWVVPHYRFVCIISLVGLIICVYGLTKIQTTVQLLKLFSSESRIINDYAWLEDNFGKLVPMELVVRVPNQATAQIQQEGRSAIDEEEPPDGRVGDQSPETRWRAMDMLQRVEAVSRIQTIVDQTFGEQGLGVVGRAMSTATFLPELPEPSNSDHSVTRYRFNQELVSGREELQESDYFRTETSGPLSGSDLYRISLRVSALSDVDYGRFIYDLRDAVEPVLEAYRADQEIARRLESDMRTRRTIVVLGRARPQRLGMEPTLTPAGEQEENSRQIDQRGIFEAVVGDLLRNHRRSRVVWHDPAGGALSGKERSDAWGRSLANADLLILLRDHEDYDLDFIKSNVKNFLDLRDVPLSVATPALVDNVPIPNNSGPVQVVYTGVVPVVYKAQRTLLYSLVESIAWAFVLIAAVMAILLNPGLSPRDCLRPKNFVYGVAAGLVAMIPNIFPVAVVFGLLCHLGVKIDIGTMMTASVAMGVAVDDTIHFLTWFRHNLDTGMGRTKAIIMTYRRVGPAMTQTTIVGGLGLFVFALSSFTPTQRFGTLMLLMLGTALIGDMLFLPALLASPLGRLFKPRIAPTSTAMDATAQQVDHEGGRGSVPVGSELQPVLRQDAGQSGDAADKPRPISAHRVD